MACIPPLEYEEVDPALQAEYDLPVSTNGRVTNMKHTLAHSPVAFQALRPSSVIQIQSSPQG